MAFSVSDMERQHFAVMSDVLDKSNENIEKLGLTQDQVNSSLDFLDREGYLSGMSFARGGVGNKILVPFTDQAAITERGIAFMKRMEVKQDKTAVAMCPTVFVSYNEKSGGEFVDGLSAEVGKAAQIVRYTNLEAWQSFKQFMNSIRQQDFAVLIITDAYLKSYACLYEVMELMKDTGWTEKTMFVVFDDARNAFNATGRASYIGFWVEKCNELEAEIKRLPAASTSELSAELKKSELIRNEIGAFLSIVGDSNNPPMYLAISKIVERIHNSCKQ